MAKRKTEQPAMEDLLPTAVDEGMFNSLNSVKLLNAAKYNQLTWNQFCTMMNWVFMQDGSLQGIKEKLKKIKHNKKPKTEVGQVKDVFYLTTGDGFTFSIHPFKARGCVYLSVNLISGPPSEETPRQTTFFNDFDKPKNYYQLEDK